MGDICPFRGLSRPHAARIAALPCSRVVLGVLRDAGYVRVRRAGNHRYYRTDKERLGPLRPALELMWARTLDDLAGAGADEHREDDDAR